MYNAGIKYIPICFTEVVLWHSDIGIWTSQTGIIVMADQRMMLVAINLYDENEDGAWFMDLLPDNIELYEAEKEEKLWGAKFFFECEYSENRNLKGQNPLHTVPVPVV